MTGFGGYDPSAQLNIFDENRTMPEPEVPNVINISGLRLHEPFTDLKDKLPPPLPGSSAERSAGALRAIVGGSIVGVVLGLLFFL